jgi:tellurium resistance protein TerZ
LCILQQSQSGTGYHPSGDEVAGKPNHIEEMVWVNLQKLPPNVSVLVFVVAAYSGGSLRDIANGCLHVMEEHESREIALIDFGQSSASVNVIAAMFRDPLDGKGPRNTWTWNLRIINEVSKEGRHFMDILPKLSEVIRTFLPHAPQRQKVAFAMDKGAVLDLPQSLAQITVGLGWDVDEGECDLDVSAVLMDGNGRDMEAVFFGRLESEEHGIQHTGDNLTGEGDGDDEQILVNLDQVGAAVQQIFFVVNIYTPQKTFRQVAEPFCRVIDNASGSELCRYALRDAGDESGLIIARISREAGDRWGFHALGLPCRGRTYKDSVSQLRAACNVKTASLMLRSQSSGSNLGAAVSEVALPPPFQRTNHDQKCCIVM